MCNYKSMKSNIFWTHVRTQLELPFASNQNVCFFAAVLLCIFNRMHSLSVLMAALGIGWPLLSVWHPALGFSSHSKDCWHSAGTWGETPSTNFCPSLQGPYKLLSCPHSLYSADLYHLSLECSICISLHVHPTLCSVTLIPCRGPPPLPCWFPSLLSL